MKKLLLLLVTFTLLTGCQKYSGGEPVEPKEEKPKEEDLNKKTKTDPAVEKEQRKTIYVNEVKSELEGVMSVYDKIWEEFWTPTFQKFSTNEITQLDAYKNMEETKNRYQSLTKQINNIKVPDGLSKVDKQKVKDFKINMVNAATLREVAAKDAAKMIDSNDFAPSKMTEIEDTVKSADAYMIKAVVSFQELEIEYRIENK